MEKLYDNGEVVTKARIQDEPWYSDYQDLMIESLCEVDDKIILDRFVKSWKEDSDKEPLAEELARWKRWAAYHAKLSQEFQADNPD